MPANLTTPRPDIVYLRRRLKRGETVAQPEAVRSSTLSLGEPPTTTPPLSLGGTSTGTSTLSLGNDSPAPFFQEERAPVAVPPTISSLTFIKEVNEAYRLSRIQSAVGSMVIGNAMVAGWQLQDGSSGYLYNTGIHVTESPETRPAEFKNRALVEFHKELLTVGLRNIKHLKRLIVVPKTGETLQAETVGGAGVIMEFEPFTALYISVVGSVIEFRKEDFRNSITETFNLHTVKPQNAPDTTSMRTLFS